MPGRIFALKNADRCLVREMLGAWHREIRVIARIEFLSFVLGIDPPDLAMVGISVWKCRHPGAGQRKKAECARELLQDPILSLCISDAGVAIGLGHFIIP